MWYNVAESKNKKLFSVVKYKFVGIFKYYEDVPFLKPFQNCRGKIIFKLISS